MCLGMYMRTTRRKNADGSTVEYHQLAENIWDPKKGCAVAKVVYNFGRADQLDAVAMRRLASSILRTLPGEEAVAAEPDVVVLDSWPYGIVHVVQSVWRELGIDRLVAELKRKAAYSSRLNVRCSRWSPTAPANRARNSTVASSGCRRKCFCRARTSWSTSAVVFTCNRPLSSGPPWSGCWAA